MASIVDYIKSRGGDSSFKARKELAKEYGIMDYVGSLSQNLELLDLLRDEVASQAEQAKYEEAATDYLNREAEYLREKPSTQGWMLLSTLRDVSPYVSDDVLKKYLDAANHNKSGLTSEEMFQWTREHHPKQKIKIKVQDRYSEPKKGSASFNKAFKEARTSGAKTFVWNGKTYTTELRK